MTRHRADARGRRIGRWLQDHPRGLELAYRIAHATLAALAPRLSPRGAERAAAWIRGPEERAKRWLFDCRSCGQCVLHETGMTCPMTCPKELRNGPCGGVRSDGTCEVAPGLPCVWLEAIRRAAAMTASRAGPTRLQPPLDRRLRGLSAWRDLLRGTRRPQPQGWPADGGAP